MSSALFVLRPVCRICGCTEHTACVDDKGVGCSWVADPLGPGPLCSSCEWIPSSIAGARTLVGFANEQVNNGDFAAGQALAAVASAYAAVASAAAVQASRGASPP